MPLPSAAARPALRGGLLALGAALLFGISTPLVQQFGVGVGPFTTAALLYAGAVAIGAWTRQPAQREAALTRADLPRLLGVAAFGAVLGPVALAWGLQRTSATGASLMLSLEAVFTALLAWAVYREALGMRTALAMALLLAGGVALVLDQGGGGALQAWGMLAVALATLAWAVDNILSRALAERDPGQVVMAKGALGVAAAGALALALGEPLPSAPAAAGLLAVGASGYGLSLRLYLLAQRAFGAARTGSVYAFAPFIGAATAIALGDRAGGLLMALAAALMLAGIALHLVESHAHEHVHDAEEHEHAHRHDDGHHDHDHPPGTADAAASTHSHRHRHAPQRHAHPHVPDWHHRHRH
jgi:drug/metabolite transporter (DMT)-like permease